MTRWRWADAAGLARRRGTWYSRIALGRARRAARSAAAGLGWPVAREFLILGCPGGDEASGLFSEVAAVVGCLDELETRPGLYAGMCVDFSEHGLYYDPAAGPNWWQYFFEPLTMGTPAGARARTVDDWEHDAFAEGVELAMSRARAAELLQRYVRVRPSLLRQRDAEWAAMGAAGHMIGVHYRGTDKWEGAPVVPYDTLARVIEQAMPAAAATRIFLATDEQSCVEFLRAAFRDRLVYRDISRAVDGRPLHKAAGSGRRKGEDAMLDCLLLARCTCLIRTDSDLGLFSTFFNPHLPVRLVDASS